MVIKRQCKRREFGQMMIVDLILAEMTGKSQKWQRKRR